MTGLPASAAPSPHVTAAAGPLSRLRLRLTAWYAGTLAVILLVLGAGLFVAISRQIAAGIDRSLARTSSAFAATLRTNGTRGRMPPMLPDRWIYLLDGHGGPMAPDTASPWIRAVAVRAVASGHAALAISVGGERTLHASAERVELGRGAPPLAAVTATIVTEPEDAYAGLIWAFALAALGATALVTAGGAFLARKSAIPVENAFQQMRRFMADAAHELRTPVAVIRAEAEVALARDAVATGDGNADREVLRRVARESEQLAGIVNDLLTLARADAGEMPATPVEVPLDDVVLDATAAASALARQRGVSLEVGECDSTTVTGDRALLRRLVIILLDNAVKYTPPGGRVVVETRAAPGECAVTVSDTGIGIPPEDLPHVFERFYRARMPGAPPGAGLGLAIARWIATVHGGSLDIASAPGSGTTATFRMRAAQ